MAAVSIIAPRLRRIFESRTLYLGGGIQRVPSQGYKESENIFDFSYVCSYFYMYLCPRSSEAIVDFTVHLLQVTHCI